MGIRMNRIYTRVGDDGFTYLANRERISKAAVRIEACGSVDELNAILGLVKVKIPAELSELFSVIEEIQQELFALGAVLAKSPAGNRSAEAASGESDTWEIAGASVANLEQLCDSFSANLPELSSFILPGGSELAALLHLARTSCRRSERIAVALADTCSEAEQIAFDREMIRYLNRLSDLLFILARWTLEQPSRKT